MALFDKMKDSISVAGQGVSQKAKTATEGMRIGNLIKANDRMIEKLTYQVGVQCVEKHVEELDSEYSELFGEILRLREENQKYRAELQQLTTANVCPKCGFSNNVSAKFCISCGAPLAAAPAGGKKCVKCGFVNAEDAAFCVECGSPLPKEEPAKAAPEAPAEMAEQDASPADDLPVIDMSVVEDIPPVNTCKNCGAVLDDSCLFCTECGTKQD